MSDGWESQRRRGPGNDWCIVKLGTPGMIKRIEVDTSHFKGNYPDTCSLDGGVANGTPLDAIEWTELLPMTRLQAHTNHVFVDEVADRGAITHVRLNIFPDGGVSRLRLFGRIA
jgi:allantoicase